MINSFILEIMKCESSVIVSSTEKPFAVLFTPRTLSGHEFTSRVLKFIVYIIRFVNVVYKRNVVFVPTLYVMLFDFDYVFIVYVCSYVKTPRIFE